MGAVTYANRIKEQLLGASRETLETVGAVSRECAVQMAKGLAEKSGADYNVAVTGIAGPGGGSKEKPVGTVYIAVEHHREGMVRALLPCPRHRNERD